MTSRPTLNQQSRTAFMYTYYKFWNQNDAQFNNAMRRIILINQKFTDRFFKPPNDYSNGSSNEKLFAYVNIGKQKIEFKADFNQNGIFSELIGTQSNLLLLELADFTSIELHIADFDEFNVQMVKFWMQFCRILRG